MTLKDQVQTAQAVNQVVDNLASKLGLASEKVGQIAQQIIHECAVGHWTVACLLILLSVGVAFMAYKCFVYDEAPGKSDGGAAIGGIILCLGGLLIFGIGIAQIYYACTPTLQVFREVLSFGH